MLYIVLLSNNSNDHGDIFTVKNACTHILTCSTVQSAACGDMHLVEGTKMLHKQYSPVDGRSTTMTWQKRWVVDYCLVLGKVYNLVWNELGTERQDVEVHFQWFILLQYFRYYYFFHLPPLVLEHWDALCCCCLCCGNSKISLKTSTKKKQT